MKFEEKIAESFLESCGFKNIQFEPKGNRTPDFVVNDEIAVEVRRLNSFYGKEAIEQVRFQFLPKVIKFIEDLEFEISDKYYFFHINYQRPIRFSNNLKDKILQCILEHQRNESFNFNTFEYEVEDNFTLGLTAFPEKLERQYNLGSYCDLDEGGAVLKNVYDSLKIIIPEKYSKIEKYKSEYDTWWLILIDFISFGIRKSEYKSLLDSIDFDLKFDKVIIVSSVNENDFIEL